MSYQQGYQYSNIPSIDQGNQDGMMGGGGGDDSMTNPNGSAASQSQQGQGGGQSQYSQPSHLSSYQEYMQNNVYNNIPSNMPLSANFGHYGPNVGSMDWFQINRRSKKNRVMVACAVALFILLVIVHPTRTGHPAKDNSVTTTNANASSTSGGTHASYNANTNNGADLNSHASNQGHKGIAGDGHYHEHDNKIQPTAEPKTEPSPAAVKVDDATTTHTTNDLKIISLLTYPRSGTSFTMLLYAINTHNSLATNYASNAHRDSDGHLFPVFPNSNEESSISDYNSASGSGSPYWEFSNSTEDRPTKFVLSLSYCHGYCAYPCTPDQYVQTLTSFEEGCRTVYGPEKSINKQEVEKESASKANANANKKASTHNSQVQAASNTGGKFLIPKSKVAKLVHLIREPLSNVVSRFHGTEQYTDNKDGFQEWCKTMDSDAALATLEYNSLLISTEVKEMMKDVPCHSEFYKYAAWHNHVVELGWNENYDSLVVYFEDYNTPDGEREQAARLANFTNVNLVDAASVPTILTRLKVRMYDQTYYTEDERESIEKFVRTLAFPRTMQLLERYFVKK